jgi:hypothetical protein
MKNLRQLFITLGLTLFFGSIYTVHATAQNKPANDTPAIGTSVTGADATGPTAINTAHGRSLDTTGVLIHKKVTYTYLKKPITDQVKVKTVANDSGAIDTSNQQTTVTDTSHQATTAIANASESDHCCGWGWLGLLGLFGLFGLRRKRIS